MFTFAVLFLLCPSSNALIEAPHNREAIGSCGNCHGEHLANSPFWGGSPDYNAFCWTRCHSSPTDRLTKGPAAKTHSSTTTNSSRATWEYQCTACHYVHSQQQNNWDARNSNAADLYLARGYLGGVRTYDGSSTTFSITSITYKNANWNPTTFKQKTEINRGVLFVPNEYYPSYNYAVYDMAADGSTVSFWGDLRTAPWVATIGLYPFRVIYGQYVKGNIDVNATPGDSADDSPVKYFDPGDGFVGDGPGTTGICQVCHTDTGFFKNDGVFPVAGSHIGRETGDCLKCHKHDAGFKGSVHFSTSFAWAGNCSRCHDPSLSIVSEIHQACGTCHVDPEGGGTLRAGDPANGIDGSAVGATNASTCVDCHLTTPGIASVFIHHDNANRAVGNCEYCHADPRPSTPGWNAAKPGDNGGNYGTNVPTQLACKECHVSYGGGNMIISKFTKSDYATNQYSTGFVKTTAHSIPNAAGRINNYGICFDCHGPDGIVSAPVVTVWHARPDKHSGAWILGVIDDERCTGYRERFDPTSPLVKNYAEYAPGRTRTGGGQIGRFNLFSFPAGFGDNPGPFDWDACDDYAQYRTTPLTFQRITVPGVLGNGSTTGSVPVFPSLVPLP